MKALLAEQDGSHSYTHKLTTLYDALSTATQNTLEREYAMLSGNRRSKSLRQLMEDHQDDFVQWRYLDAADRLKGEPQELQLAISAILTIYNDAGPVP